MKARVQNVSLGNARRIVAVSDVHGNGRLLERLLEEIAFCKEDALILLGDHIEKGKESLSPNKTSKMFEDSSAN